MRKALFYFIYFLVIILLFLSSNSCHKDCHDFDSSNCPGREDQYIIVKFNMDSLNIGFTLDELENFEITFAREYYTEKRQPATQFLGFDFENFVFKGMYSYYCCGDENVGLKMFNNNTGTVHVVNNIKYKKERTYDYCCGNYYYLKQFDFNGNRMFGGDTIFINNE